ncbi:protein of unknown function [Modestobacter italicus]|uniref:Uncharacterized protein n=1 Tax=Modestobacter italicus (strain DSM 44449 / CECT 9708 / BC 501) TaxID=2732864 RepID=I4EZ07_MODI5|nr:protein of unknown function [Modestobacter marinus]
MRTQQRAESQCQVSIPPGLTAFMGGHGLGFLWLIERECQLSVSAAIKSSTESLILAQDERWRRA